MNLLELVLVLAVVAAVAAVVAGVVRADLDEPTSSLPQAGLPAGELDAEDVAGVRFSLGFRGYRMSEVDDVLDRLAAELARSTAELQTLRQTVGRPADEQASATPAAEAAGAHRAVGSGWTDAEQA